MMMLLRICLLSLLLKGWILTALAVSASEPSLNNPPPGIIAGEDKGGDILMVPAVFLCLLDRVTGRIFTIKANLHQMVVFDNLRIIPRICYRRVKTKVPESVAFLEIWDIRAGQSPQLLFSNWMFSAHPEMSALEHPVYDVWVQNHPSAIQGRPHLQNKKLVVSSQ